MPPSDFSGRCGRCGTQSLMFGSPERIRSSSAVKVAPTPAFAMLPASSRLTSRPETGINPASARRFGSDVPPISVPRDDFLSPTLLALAPGAFAPAPPLDAFRRCLPASERMRRVSSARAARALISSFETVRVSPSSCSIQLETGPFRSTGAPSKEACGDSPKPLLSRSSPAIPAGLPVFLSRGFAMAGIWTRLAAKERPEVAAMCR